MNSPSAASIVLILFAMAGCDRAPTPAPFWKSVPDLSDYDITRLQREMQAGTVSSRQITQWSLNRIAAIDDAGPMLNAVIAINPDALAIADERDAERRAGRIRGPLHGIPVLLKDNIDTGDRQLTTAGSLALTGAPAPQDAEVTRRLREAGAIILGKTNLSEWANIRSTHSSSGWSAVGGLTRNPHVLDRTPCGSSSGSGVAVAAGFVVAAVGTETDGSILCPASVNGVVGFKPTVGLVSRRGIVPIAHSQDTAGPMTRSVADAAIMLDAIAGTDAGDRATAEADSRRSGFHAALDAASLRGRRLGVVRNHGGGDGASKDVLDAVVATLRAEGAQIVDPVLLPAADQFADELTVLLYELKADLGTYLRVRGANSISSLADVIAFNERESAIEMAWFGQELFIEAEGKGGLGSEEYRSKLARMRRLAGEQGIDKVMATHHLDALVAITSGPAWVVDLIHGDNWNVPSSTTPAAIAGYPSVSVPAGFQHGLPVGVSFFAGAWQDARVLAIADAFEQAHRARRPPAFLPSIADIPASSSATR